MASGLDGSSGWVIALACFGINFLMAGLARTAGVLYVAIIDLYGVSREAATTPFSIRVCIRNLTGPLIGLLGQKYGIRIVTTIGGFIAALGSVLCYFAPNVLWITIFWGLIHGLGFGLNTVLHMMTIGQYFDKYRASALGLGFSGDCFGTFAFPLIMEFLLSTYGLKGTFLIIGGLVLNTVPLALLLRKPPWLKKIKPKFQKASVKKNNVQKKCDQLETDTIPNNLQQCERNKKLLKSNSQIGMLSTVDEIDNFEREETEDVRKNEPGECQFSTFGYDREGVYNKAFQLSESDLTILNEEMNGRSSGNINRQNSLNKFDKGKNITPSSSCDNFSATTSKSFQSSDLRSSNSSLRESKTFKKSDDLRVCSEIKLSRSVTDLNQKNRSMSDVNRTLRLCSALQNDRRDSMPQISDKEKKNKEVCINSSTEDTLKVEEAETLRIDAIGTPKKRRTSSFVGQVALDIVNRMRTASFASQVCQDAFVSPLTREPDEFEAEQKSECELKCIVEHKDHGIDDCAQQGLTISVEKMMGDYFKEITEKTESVAEQKIEPPSVFKILLRTNMKPMFILISLSMAVYAFLFVSVLTIIIDHAKDLDISKDRGKYLIIGFSVADLVGRLGFGQVIDRNLMKMKNYAGCTMFLMGALVAVIPLNPSFNYMMVCMSMYGLVQGGTAIMTPILIHKYMDKNSESVAMGSVNFYGGFLMLMMAPMIGFFRDKTGSYNFVFYITGGVSTVVGILWQFEPMIMKFQNRKMREKYMMRGMNAANIPQ